MTRYETNQVQESPRACSETESLPSSKPDPQISKKVRKPLVYLVRLNLQYLANKSALLRDCLVGGWVEDGWHTSDTPSHYVQWFNPPWLWHSLALMDHDEGHNNLDIPVERDSSFKVDFSFLFAPPSERWGDSFFLSYHSLHKPQRDFLTSALF